jgi:hypothetical protein
VVAVALNATGASPATAADAACTESTRSPSNHRVRATPSAPVVLAAGLTLPLPAAAAQATCTPGTGLP